MKNVTIITIVILGIGLPIYFGAVGGSQQTDMEALIPQIKPSVVHIQAPGWQGSGFVVSDYLIATARHVVKGASDFTITLNDGTELQTTKAMSSKEYDIGFLYVSDGIPAPAVKLGSVLDCLLGTPVVVIGSSYGAVNFNCVSTGIISGLDRDWDEIDPYTGMEYGWEWGFTTDASAAPGNSGCPLFTMDGVVRGILVGGYDSTHIFLMSSDLFMHDLPMIEAAFRAEERYEISVPDYQESY